MSEQNWIGHLEYKRPGNKSDALIGMTRQLGGDYIPVVACWLKAGPPFTFAKLCRAGRENRPLPATSYDLS